MRALKRIPKIAAIVVSVAGFFASLGLSQQLSFAAELPGKGVTVRWVFDQDIESRFQGEVVSIGLERLGYTVKLEGMLAVPVEYVAVAQGDADLTPEVWWPLHTKFFESAGGTAKMTRVGILIAGAVQGYLIDKRTAQKYGITNLTQLRDPKIAKIFDTDADGKANLTGCPAGWGCERVIEHHMDAYKLRDTVTHDQGDFAALRADVITRYKAGQPILYYTYTPLWVNQVLVPGKEVEWLVVSFTSLPPEQMKPGVKTTLPDGRNVGFEVQTIEIVANNKFLAANPAARRWLELVKIPIEDVDAENYLIYKGEKSFAHIRRHAEEWVKKNQAKFEAWIAEAIKAAK